MKRELYIYKWPSEKYEHVSKDARMPDWRKERK